VIGLRRYRCRTHGIFMALRFKAEIVCRQCGQVAERLRDQPQREEDR